MEKSHGTKENGVSLAEKVGAAETAAEFFARRGKGGDKNALLKFLRSAPDVPPMPGDELPPEMARSGKSSPRK